MKKTIIILSALITLTGFNACQRELQAPDQARTLEIPVVLEDATKVDANVNTGACTWTTGDEVAVYVSGAGANHYQAATVTSSRVTVSLSQGQALANYAVYPNGFQDISNYMGDTPGVIYPATYDFTGHADLSTGTYTMAPMMAKSTEEELKFYNVGGMLRLNLTHVPENTAKIQVVFSGIDHVCGTCTVSKPGTVNATTTVTVGGGNTITATGFTYAASMNVNLPIPCGDYSGLKAIHVKALDSTNAPLKQVSISVIGTWGTLKHGHARIIPADFDADILSQVSLSSSAAATLWKGETEQRSAKALYPDGTQFKDCAITWESSVPTVASVDETTGLVTALSAGSTTITATATASIGGTPVSSSYVVYVNSVSAMSVTGPAMIAPGSSASVSATITHTNNGYIVRWPVITWNSATISRITLTASSSYPAYTTATTATAVITAEGKTQGGSSVVTATLDDDYSSTGSDIVSSKTISCDYPADLTFPAGGEKYKFRGYYMHPGVLFWNGSSLSITDASDPLVLLQHYYYDSQTTKFDGSTGSAWVDCCYFTWAELDTRLGGGAGTTITGTVSAPDPVTGASRSWRIPTLGSSSGELYTIFNTNPTYGIKVNSLNSGNPYTNSTANYIFVNVNLSDAPSKYIGKGLGYSGDATGNAAGAKTYQAGILLVPDGAYLICSGIKSVPGNSGSTTASGSYNVISYDDLEKLTTKGCVFLPSAGWFMSGSWMASAVFSGLYWSASPYNSNAYMFEFSNSALNFGSTSNIHMPVRLIRN